MRRQTWWMWFEALTGFNEREKQDVAAQFVVDGEYIVSEANGRRMRHGRFTTPSLGELRERVDRLASTTGSAHIREVVANVRDLHVDPTNAGALFQVASQFNTLEMVSPSVTPEAGIDGYEHDHTQGPACAMACGAGIIFRNYLVPLSEHRGAVGHVGQSAEHQIGCLADLLDALDISIDMQNGYALPTAGQLDEISQRLVPLTESERSELMATLRIGVHADTEVTLDSADHVVTQAYCSALPVAYAAHDPQRWEPFARLVLDASYEATLAEARLNAGRTGKTTAFLTLLGGGAFGNETGWIIDAIERAAAIHEYADLDIAIVSHRSPHPDVERLLSR